MQEEEGGADCSFVSEGVFQCENTGLACTSILDCVVAPAPAAPAPPPYIFGNNPPYSHNPYDTLPILQLTSEGDAAALLGAIAVTSFGALVALFTQTVVASRRSDFVETFLDVKKLLQRAIDRKVFNNRTP